MIKKLKSFTINLMAGANVATVLLMVLAGYSDHLDPREYPLLSVMGMTFPVFLIANLVFLFFWLTFKWRKIWIPIVGYAVVYVPLTTYMPIHKSQEMPDGTIKLISYNVCQYGGNYKYEYGFETVSRMSMRLRGSWKNRMQILYVYRKTLTPGDDLYSTGIRKSMPITTPPSSIKLPPV